MAGGLKSVRNRRDDALSRIGWDRLESMLAEHYRCEGYAVEHVGTGVSGRKFDGGIDLKLRRTDEYVLVQSKHWNAMQVPHNAVHELLGVMVNEGATGAILVTSGEFTRAAIEAAAKQGHVQLVDGDDLRAMLGPLPELSEAADPDARWRRGVSVDPPADSASKLAKALLDHAAARIIVAAEDRVRGRGRSGVSKTTATMDGVLIAKLAIAAFALLLVFWGTNRIFSTIRQIPLQQQARMQAANATHATQAPQSAVGMAQPSVSRQAANALSSASDAHSYGRRDPDPCHELVDWQSGTYVDHCKQETPHNPTAAEIRESQRKADEAMKVIEANTPQM